MRREQNVELSELGNGNAGEILAGLRCCILTIHVPCVVAAHDRNLLLIALERRATASAGRVISLPAGQFLARDPGVVVDRARVGRYFETRPVVLRTVALTHGGIPAGPGILN